MNTKNHSSIKSKRDNPSSQKQPSRQLPSYVVVFISIIVLAYYIWTAGSNGVPLIVVVGPEHHEQIRTPNLFPDISPHHYGFYNLMADAFEAGQMHLLIKPPKEMLDLQNPRDPEQNAKWRILDLSIYKDKYYIYFGPVPTLLLFIPFRWLGIGKISEPLGVAIFSYGIFLCSLYIILYTVKKHIPNANRNLVLLSIIAAAFSSAIPYNLRHPVVYEIALSSGAFFAMLGLALILRSRDGERCSFRFLIVASCAFGLSVGCRPIYVFAAIFLFTLWLLLSFKNKFQWKESLVTGLSLALPFTAFIAAVALYNYARFGSFSEFGADLMTNATLWNTGFSYRFCNIAPGIFLRAFCPPQFSDVFPFIRLHQFYPFDLPEGYSLEEVSAGFLLTTPIILLFFCLATSWVKKTKTTAIFFISSLLIFFGLGILLPESYMLFSNSMRYQLDFAPYILLGCILGSLHIESQAKQNYSWLLRFGMILSLIFGILVHLAFGMTGIFDTFRRGEPRLYFALEDFCRPVSAMLRPFFGSDQTKILDITIPNGSARLEDGSEGQWLGEEGAFVRFTASQPIRMKFSTDLVVRPGLPDGVKFEFRGPTEERKISVCKGTTRQSIQFTLQPGVNRISLFATPNGSTLIDNDKSRLLILKNIHISPN